MNEVPDKSAIRQIVEEAADLAARALGCCLAQAIESYVPHRYADGMKVRLALELLGAVESRFPRPRYVTEH
jgi:hypothetical protein